MNNDTNKNNLNILPNHIAFIPDGNRPWASSKEMESHLGHKEGITVFFNIIRASNNRIPYITFWALSKANFIKRSPNELKYLFAYFKEVFKEINSLKEFQSINISILGESEKYLSDKTLLKLIKKINNRNIKEYSQTVTILLGYDGQDEMLDAINKLKNNNLEINESNLKKCLLTGHLPPVDLLIRTGGEPHLSCGFMMWLTSNSEIYFDKEFWPDFNEKSLEKALLEYTFRRRMNGS